MMVTMALPLEAAIEHAGGPPADVVHGLDLLARSPPLWPIGTDYWSLAVATVEEFAARWHSPADELGWSLLQLYGLDRRAPYASLAGMGAAFVVARCGHHVVDVTAETIRVRSRSGADLRIYRRELGTESVLAWSLCAPGNVR
jgi:hypothetical protein